MSFQNPLWWQTGVIYQIYPRSFQDTNGNGVGDLPGITRRLDYLSDVLGVDTIWLSPFYPSPMADFGYDVADYTNVDPLFGTLADFDELVAGAHRRNLQIIIDLVPNHTSDQHPWFLESRSTRDNPRRDWYVWADPKADGSPPNNWLSVFGGSAWEWDDATGQFYLHSFLKEQPDLNWRNPEVQAAMFDVVRFWLDRGVDGFRIDVAHFILKDPDLRDNPIFASGPITGLHKSFGDYDFQEHRYDKGHPDVHEVYRQFRQVLDSYSQERPRMAVGEIHIFDFPVWATYYGEKLDEIHMPFNFALLGIAWRAEAVRQVVDALEAALPNGAWPNYVLGNHDESRLASRIGRNPARVAAILLLTLRGTPTLYYGDALGMMAVEIPPDLVHDPWGLRVPGLGRDPQRTPMQWSDEHHAGFSASSTPRLWLPLSPDYRIRNVRTQSDDPYSMLNLYRRLLAYRRESPALQIGTYQPLDSAPKDCYAFLRQHGAQRVLVALNFSSRGRILRIPELGRGRLVLSTHLDREEEVDLRELPLRGNEGVIVGLADEGKTS